MERGVAITLIILAMILVFGVLVYTLINPQIISTNYDANDKSYSESKTSWSKGEEYSKTTTSSGYSDSNPSVIIIDNRDDNNKMYRDDYYRNYIVDKYGRKYYTDSVSSYRRDYYSGVYRDNNFRCYEYYDRYDRMMRTHCSRIDDRYDRYDRHRYRDYNCDVDCRLDK